jgi:dTDP-4-amino-4,6-dideoxygalactose transaminase
VNEVGQGIGPCPRKENLKILFQAVAMSCFLHPRLFWIPANLPGVRLGETFFDLSFPISRLGGVQAGLAHNWVARLKNFCRVRQTNAQALLTAVPQLKAISPMLPGLAGYGSRLPIFVADDFAREALITEGWEKGLGIALTYPDAVDGIPYFRQALWHGTFPQARRLCRETVTLPIHPLMAATDLERIINLLHRFW